jgi:hypothetical protein
MEPSHNQSTLFPNLRRRDVLAFASGAALLPTVSWAGLESRGELALGYCREPLPDAEDLATAVVPAGRLGIGDPELARHGARVTVHGLAGDAQGLGRMGIRALDLTVHYDLKEAGCGGVDVRAWSCQLLPVEHGGTANSFTVPVEGGLRLALEIETPMGVERREAVLVTGREAGRPKLRTGRYLIVPGGALPRRYDLQRPEPMIEVSVEAV